jgi:hypothetical protein
MWKGQLSNLIHIAWQVHVCTPKQTLPLPLQYKLAMPDDQFIFSSSWLPSPRFELRTLAGYNVSAAHNSHNQDVCVGKCEKKIIELMVTHLFKCTLLWSLQVS